MILVACLLVAAVVGALVTSPAPASPPPRPGAHAHVVAQVRPLPAIATQAKGARSP